MATRQSSQASSGVKRTRARRSRPSGFLFGVWIGAGALGCLAAYAWTHMLTGKLFVPGREGGGQLMEVSEVTEHLDTWIAKIEGGDNDE